MSTSTWKYSRDEDDGAVLTDIELSNRAVVLHIQCYLVNDP